MNLNEEKNSYKRVQTINNTRSSIQYIKVEQNNYEPSLVVNRCSTQQNIKNQVKNHINNKINKIQHSKENKIINHQQKKILTEIIDSNFNITRVSAI